MEIQETDFIHIQNIRNSINEILSYTEDVDAQTFSQEEDIRTAVYRELGSIGEAASMLTDETKETRFGDFDLRNLENFKTIMHNEELETNHQAVWSIIEHDLPELMEALDKKELEHVE